MAPYGANKLSFNSVGIDAGRKKTKLEQNFNEKSKLEVFSILCTFL